MPTNCPPGKILNPKTGRCVLIKHAAKHGIENQNNNENKDNNNNNKDKEKEKDKKKDKETKKPIECPPGKVLNPKTGKCILKKNAHKYGIHVSPPKAESPKKPKHISPPKKSPKESPKKESPKKSGINYFFDPVLKLFAKAPIDKNLLERAKVLQKELQKARNRLHVVEGEYKLQQFRVSKRIYGDLLNELNKYVTEASKSLNIISLLQLRYAQNTFDYQRIFNIIKAYIPNNQKTSFANFTEIFKEKSTKIDVKLKSIAASYKNITDEYNKLNKQFQDIQKKLPKLALPPVNAFSPVTSGPGLLTNKYLVVGHGYELPVKFEKRRIIPMNQTLVVFPSSGLSNYSDKSCKFTEFFHNPKNSKILSDPVKYKDKIENALKYPIRVYKPGDLMPNIKTTLFLQFINPTGISLVKSGVFKAGVMRKIDSNIMKPSSMFSKFQKECFDYSGIIQSPKEYTVTVHKELYKDNVYKLANNYVPFQLMGYKKYVLSDIMKTVGNGVYYFVGCRDALEAVPNSVIAMSNAQQNKK